MSTTGVSPRPILAQPHRREMVIQHRRAVYWWQSAGGFSLRLVIAGTYARVCHPAHTGSLVIVAGFPLLRQLALGTRPACVSALRPLAPFGVRRLRLGFIRSRFSCASAPSFAIRSRSRAPRASLHIFSLTFVWWLRTLGIVSARSRGVGSVCVCGKGGAGWWFVQGCLNRLSSRPSFSSMFRLRAIVRSFAPLLR
ncbi:hypothetical protein B0H12DRAFT_1239255 [Mycena haematopus]|nr:hypothetical protein B0H12DRAFT_1239255 [Mycena haematopus]